MAFHSENVCTMCACGSLHFLFSHQPSSVIKSLLKIHVQCLSVSHFSHIFLALSMAPYICHKLSGKCSHTYYTALCLRLTLYGLRISHYFLSHSTICLPLGFGLWALACVCQLFKLFVRDMPYLPSLGLFKPEILMCQPASSMFLFSVVSIFDFQFEFLMSVHLSSRSPQQQLTLGRCLAPS